MSQADAELQRACLVVFGYESMPDVMREQYGTTEDYAEQVLDVLGRIGPVTAWVLALREHRKRVENDTGSPLPDQTAWGWKDNNHVG